MGPTEHGGEKMMNELAPDTILQRLNRLEREARWWKRAGIAAITLLALGVLLGVNRGQEVDKPEELRVKRVLLVDAQGTQRGRVGIEADGTPRFFLDDPSGTPRVGIAVTADGRPGLTLYDQTGKPRAGLGMAADGRVDLALGDQTSTSRAALVVA